LKNASCPAGQPAEFFWGRKMTGTFLVKKIGLILCGACIVAASVFLVPLLKDRVSFATPPETAAAGAINPPAVPVTVIEYSDYECTACATLEPVLREKVAGSEGKINLVFRHFPIQSHKLSPMVHQAAECANEQGAFWPFHERVYQTQDTWLKAADPKDEMLNIARDCNLDLNKFLACLGNPLVTEKIRRDYLSGQALKIKSTPTIFIGDRMFVGKKQFEEEGIPYIDELLNPRPPQKNK